MTITVNLEEIFAWVGTAACIIVPAIISLALYANFGVYRRKSGEGDKWNR